MGWTTTQRIFSLPKHYFKLGITSLSTVEYNPEYIQPLLDSPTSLRKDINSLKTRVDKIEKIVYKTRPSDGVTDFVKSLPTNMLEFNVKTVEKCSVFSFFLIGTILGASLFDRLWLLGGIVMGWWAAGAVRRDTLGGTVTRRVGVQLAQLIRDIQEKYLQFVIFYRTGKLAYVTSKIWQQYDTQFHVSTTIDALKRQAMLRASEFQFFGGSESSLWNVSNQLQDVWKGIASLPDVVVRLDSEYGVTSSVVSYSQAAWTSVKGWYYEGDVVGYINDWFEGKGGDKGSRAQSNQPRSWFESVFRLPRRTTPRAPWGISSVSTNKVGNTKRAMPPWKKWAETKKKNDFNLWRGRLINPWPSFSPET